MILEALKRARPAVARIVGVQDADDCLQDAAARALSSAARFKGESSYETWFYAIAVRCALMKLRRKERNNVELIDVADERETLDDCIDRERRAQRLYEAIAELTPKRKLAALRWLAGEKLETRAEKALRHCAKVELRDRLRGMV